MIEAIRRLAQFGSLSQYTYIGLGGPYLEDFRILYEQFNDIGMVSIEKHKETFKRQQFHVPCKTIDLRNMDLYDFVDDYESDGQKSIIWLDYTDLTYQNFEYFMLLLSKVTNGSLVKITLRCHALDYLNKEDTFKEEFQALMPNPSINPPQYGPSYSKLIQDMLQIASQKALSGQRENTFQPITSFYYSDGTGILTVTGIVCTSSEAPMFKSAFNSWKFANLNWDIPRKIDVPVLSTKERLNLQDKLPCNERAGDALLSALGYLLESSGQRTKAQLEQYSDFHRYYPYFIRAVP